LALDVIDGGEAALQACREVSLEDAAAVWRGDRGAVWVDVQAPSAREMADVGRVFGLNRLVIDNALRPNLRPKIDNYGDYITLALYVPHLGAGEDEDAGTGGGAGGSQSTDSAGDERVRGARTPFVPPLEMERGGVAPLREVFLVFGGRFLVTVHREPIPVLGAMPGRLFADAALRQQGAGGLVHHVVDEIVDAYFPFLDALAEQVEDVQEFAFVGVGRPGDAPAERRRQMRRLFRLKRALLALRRVAVPQSDALRMLARDQVTIFAGPTPISFQDVFDHSTRVQQTIQLHYELLTSAREAFLTRVSNELGVASRTLLAITCFVGVPTLVTALYGTNFARIPELGWPYGYLWALLLIALLDGALVLLARRRRWV
jgi:magnesium transporter